jgi:hypothetical protein
MTGNTKCDEHVVGKGLTAYSIDNDSGTLGVLTNSSSVSCIT